MSMNNTDKWASRIINELFEENTTFDKNGEEVKLMDDKKNDVHEVTFGDISRDEYEFCRVEVTNTEIKLMERDNDLNLTFGKSLNSDEGDFQVLHIEHDVSLSISKTDRIQPFMNEQDISSKVSCKIYDHESKRNDNRTSKMFNNSKEIEPLKSVDMLSISENDIKKNNFENSSDFKTEELEISKSDIVSTIPFKHDSSKTDSPISQNKKEIKKDKFSFPALELELMEEDSKALQRVDKKVKLLGFRGYDKQNVNKDKKFRHSNSLSDLYFEYFVDNFIKEEMEYCWGKCDSTFRKNYGYKTNLKPCKENLSESKKSNAKNGDFSVEDDYKSLVTKVYVEGKDLSHECTKSEDENKIISLKRKCRRPMEDHHGSLDSIYQKFEKKRSKRSIVGETKNFRNSMLKNTLKYHRTCPLSNTSEEETDYEERSTKYFTKKNYALLSKNFNRKRNNASFDFRDEDEIVHQRTYTIIRLYRNACSVLEGIFIIPCVILIAESVDLLIFLFFMVVCVLYLLYEKVRRRMLSFSFQNITVCSDGISGLENDMTVCDEECSNLSTNSQKSETVRNESIKHEASVINFSSKKDVEISKEFDSKILSLTVHSKDVLVFDALFEVVKQNLESIYEKLEYCDFVREKYTTVEKFDEDNLVDIIMQANQINTEVNIGGKDVSMEIMKRNDENPEIMEDESEFDMEIIASSKKLQCKLHELEKISKLPQTLQKISIDCKQNEEQEIKSPVNAKVPNLTIFPNLFDLDEEYILNSTEVDNAEIYTKAKPKENFNILTNSNGDVSVASKYNISSKTEKSELGVSNSSMNVNMPSFSSRSDIDFQTDSSSALDNVSDKMCFTSAPNEKLSRELKMAHGDQMDLFIDLSSLNSKDSESNKLSDKQGDLVTTSSKMLVTNSAEIKSPGNLDNDLRNVSIYSDYSSSASTNTNPHISDIIYETSFLNKNIEFITDTSNDKSESESFAKAEAVSTDKKVSDSRSSGGLRRRMSLILNNCKNLPGLHCATAHSKKKYKKHHEN